MLVSALLNPEHYAPSAAGVPMAATGIALLSLGTAVLFYEGGRRLSRLFFVLAFLIAHWLFSFALMFFSAEESVRFFWTRFAYLGIPLIPVAALHFSAVVMRNYRRRARAIAICWVLGTCFSILGTFTGFIFDSFYHYPWGPYPRFNQTSWSFLLFFFSILIWVMRDYWRAYEHSPAATIHQHRIGAFMRAFAVAYVACIDYIPVFGWGIYPFGYLLIAAFLVLAARAILSYRLADITPAFAGEQIIEAMPDGLVVYDHEGTVRIANSALARLLGWPRDALLNRPVSLLLRACHDDPSKLPFKSGDIDLAGHECRWSLESGRSFCISLSSTGLHDEVGDRVGTVLLVRDVTERKLAEKSLAQERDKAQRYLDIAGTILIALNTEGKVTLINRKGCEVLQVEEEEVIGQDWIGRFVSSPARAAARSAFRALFTEDAYSVEYFESPVVTREGEERLIAWINTVLSDEVGRPVGTLSSGEDITERRQVERQLVEAKVAAEQAAKAKSEFLANMSYQIRAPLNTMLGMNQLLLQSGLNPEQLEYAVGVQASGGALLHVISDILDFSKIEAGKIHLEQRPFSLRGCVEEALHLLEGQAAAKKIELSGHVADPVPAWIVGDQRRVRQILLTLIGNAVKFTERGEVEVTVASVPRDHQEHCIHFKVRDTGIGIPKDRLDKVFEAFRPVDASAMRRFPGTGLGLAISRRLAVLMGGDVWAESEVGRGSTFYVTLTAKGVEQPIPPEGLGCRIGRSTEDKHGNGCNLRSLSKDQGTQDHP
jgi:PAS domain S-box-containing protein